MTITYKNTKEQFLSQIGGVINFYFGVCGLSIIALVIFYIDFAKRWNRSKKVIAGVAQEQHPTQEVGIELQNNGFVTVSQNQLQNIMKGIIEEALRQKLVAIEERMEKLENLSESSRF